MLALDQDILDAANQGHLAPGLRYVVQRFAEAVGPGTHFSASASFVLTPETAVSELHDLATRYGANYAHPHRLDVARACAWTRKALAFERNLWDWFGTEMNAVLQALRKFNREASSRRASGRVLRPIAAHDLAPALGRLRNVLRGDGADSYRACLLRSVLSEAVADHPRWDRLDHDVRRLAAVALEEGRDGPTHARLIAAGVTRAATDVAACELIEQVLTADPAPFEVAATILGAGALSGSLPPGIREWHLGGGFLHGTSADAEALARYHRLVRGPRRNVVLLVEVPKAFDAQHARQLALEQIELVQDGLHAEHRATTFTVDPRVLVHGPDGARSLATSISGGVARGRVPAPAMLVRLSQPLRLLANARNEAAPAMAITDVFIALEYLSQDARPTTRTVHKSDFLPAVAAGSAELVAAQQVIAGSYALTFESARRCGQRAAMADLAAWLGSAGDPHLIDIARWTSLLDELPGSVDSIEPSDSLPKHLDSRASTAAAALWLRALLTHLPVLAQVRVITAGRLWRQPSAIHESVASESRWASAHTDRLRMRRNAMMHGALLRRPGDRELAANGLHILDALLAIVPRYLSPVTSETWLAMWKARIWRRSLWRDWSAGRRPDPRMIVGSSADVAALTPVAQT